MNENIKEILKSRMEFLGYTNYELHKRSKVSQSALSRYFNGESDMTLSVFLKICDALQLRMSLTPNEFITKDMSSSFVESNLAKKIPEMLEKRKND